MVDGAARERELCEMFAEEDWAVMRAPASGAATERELPDIFAGAKGRPLFAIEAKASKRDAYIYIDEREVEELDWFARCFDALPRIGARYNYHDWAFFHPDDLHRTPQGNYRVTEADLENGEAFGDLLQ